MRVYFDACCFSRLHDDQSQPRVRDEASCIDRLFEMVVLREIELISSEMLEDEVRRNPSVEQRKTAQSLLSFATVKILLSASLMRRAETLKVAGYGAFDAYHIAAAEAANADILMTTDDRMLSKAARGIRMSRPEHDGASLS